MKQVFLSCLLTGSAGVLSAQTNSPDSVAIRSTIQQFENSWNHNDMDAYVNFFTPDGSWINIGGMYWKDRNEVGKAMHLLGPEFKKMTPQKLNIQKIQFVAQGVAEVFIREEIHLNQDWVFPNGEKAGAKGDVLYGQMSLLVVNVSGHWKIKAGHNTTIDPKVAAFNPINAK